MSNIARARPLSNLLAERFRLSSAIWANCVPLQCWKKRKESFPSTPVPSVEVTFLLARKKKEECQLKMVMSFQMPVQFPRNWKIFLLFKFSGRLAVSLALPCLYLAMSEDRSNNGKKVGDCVFFLGLKVASETRSSSGTQSAWVRHWRTPRLHVSPKKGIKEHRNTEPEPHVR